ncbi:MAG: ABC transporter ATP-binding protein [Gammaproteobacteria bacterium]|nr:ABC transporter ATP-binding protein [Gammaproteobacteria bacterium]MBU1656449.1 ABC transporter ATP-binding protein [Gammaproteobacteria bacterium]MBU1961473.1 ABC transporter ATP-binding protein [Gammaproteobacteria bacterium]
MGLPLVYRQGGGIAMEENNGLIVEDVYKAYGAKVVLDNLDLRVRNGEFCTLVGPSGCGKSTLLRLILGEEQPTAGRITLNGEPLGPPSIRRGIVFQRYSLFPHLSVIDNVSLGLRLGGRPTKESRAEAMQYLERMRLAEHAGKYPHQLSGGMQQRVAIAQSLILKPEILLMDEPFGALDPDTREDMQLFLLELWEQEQMTLFFVTHDLEEAAFLGTRILVLSQYYTDDRGNGDGVNRGAKIVADHQLPRSPFGTGEKFSRGFGQLIAQIREVGFNPAYLQHARDFNLKHPDAFQTLTEMELRG